MKTALCRYFTGTLLKYKSPKITQIGSQTSWLEKAWLRFLNSGLPRKMSSQWQDSRNRTNGIGISNPTSDHSYSLHPIHVIVTVSAACTSHLHPWRFSVEGGAWIVFRFFSDFFDTSILKPKPLWTYKCTFFCMMYVFSCFKILSVPGADPHRFPPFYEKTVKFFINKNIFNEKKKNLSKLKSGQYPV